MRKYRKMVARFAEKRNTLTNYEGGELMRTKELKKKPIFILGNKTDLDQKVSVKEIENFAFNIEAKHFFISAKTNENMDKAFNKIIGLE